MHKLSNFEAIAYAHSIKENGDAMHKITFPTRSDEDSKILYSKENEMCNVMPQQSNPISSIIKMPRATTG